MPIFPTKQSCVGCTACASACPKQCIEMKKDKYGFQYPELVRSEQCIECGRCEKVCPVLREGLVGPELPIVYAAMSMDEEIREESSSGGVFSELAKWVIAQGGVVFGAEYDAEFKVRHCMIDAVEDLKKLRGAKYAESELEGCFSEILERLKNGQKVLFSGAPCQVAGLKSLVGAADDNLYCVDFVCHGVPSPMAWEEYVKYRAKTDADGELPSRVNLRSKHTGWSRYQYSNLFEYPDGTSHSATSSQSLFMKLFVGDYISRESCAECRFKGYQRISDLTLGDFWGIWDMEPEMDDNKGTSVVLVHTEKGQKLWQEIGDQIQAKEVTLDQASAQNPSMIQQSKAHPERNVALEKMRGGEIASCEAYFEVPSVPLKNRIKRKIKGVLRLQ